MATPVVTDIIASVASTTHTVPSPSPTGLAALGVDGPLILVQAVNFFLLLAILFWLLYRPVLRLLAERERRIADGLAAAEQQKKIAAETEAARSTILAEARSQAEDLRKEVQAELKQERERALAELKQERERLQADLAKDRAALTDRVMTDARRELAGLVTLAASRLIGTTNKSTGETNKELAAVLKELS